MAQPTTREVIESYKDRLTAIFQDNAGQGRGMLGLHNLKVRSFVLMLTLLSQRQASESGSRLSRPSIGCISHP